MVGGFIIRRATAKPRCQAASLQSHLAPMVAVIARSVGDASSAPSIVIAHQDRRWPARDETNQQHELRPESESRSDVVNRRKDLSEKRKVVQNVENEPLTPP